MEIRIESDLSKIEEVTNKIIFSLQGLELEKGMIFRLRLALEEAIVNAIRHGNKFNLKLTVAVNFSREKNKIILTVEDEGKGFDCKNLADPTHKNNLLKTSGRGIFLIRNIMDKVEFNEKGNKITMIKFF